MYIYIHTAASPFHLQKYIISFLICRYFLTSTIYLPILFYDINMVINLLLFANTIHFYSCRFCCMTTYKSHRFLPMVMQQVQLSHVPATWSLGQPMEFGSASGDGPMDHIDTRSMYWVQKIHIPVYVAIGVDGCMNTCWNLGGAFLLIS